MIPTNPNSPRYSTLRPTYRVALALMIFLVSQALTLFLSHYGLIVALLASLIVGACPWIFVESHRSIPDDLTDTNLPMLFFMNIVLLFLLSLIWNIVGTNILGISHVGHLISQNQQNIVSFLHAPITLIFILIYGIIIGPMVEEFIFRVSIIGPNPKPGEHLKLKIFISAALFSILHLLAQFTRANLTPEFWRVTIYYFVLYAILGVDFAIFYAKYRNYRLNVMLHASWNAIAFLGALL